MPIFAGRSVVLTVVILLMAAPSLAQQPSRNHQMPGAPSAAGAGGSLTEAMETMDKGMTAAPMTGDTDKDFVAMMIPHHQGAVDMAKVELASGKDPQLRRLARNIIAAQEREIGQMQRWQAAHAAPRQ